MRNWFKNWFVDLAEIPPKDFNPQQGVSSRLAALDLARCLAMFLMVQGHVVFQITDPETLNPSGTVHLIWSFIRGLTAPVFLLVSGAVQVFANKRDEITGRVKPKHITRRVITALMLIGMGHLLTFPAHRLFHLPFIDSLSWLKYFQVNILQLIGVSILLLLFIFILIKSDKLFFYVTLSIGLLIFFLTPLVRAIDMYNYLPDFIAAYFSKKHGSIFTIFPFTGFLFIGAAFGTLIKFRQPELRLNFILKFSLIAGIIISALSYPVSYYLNSSQYSLIHVNETNSGLQILRLGLVFIFLFFTVLLYRKTTRFSGWYSLFGKRALFVYVIHLLMIYGTPWNISFGQIFQNSVPIYLSLPIAWVVILLSAILVWFYDYTTRKSNDNLLLYRYAVGFFVIFLLLV